MKIVEGHYVPKELITSEAVHEAVVKCFVAAEMKKLDAYGNYGDDGCFTALSTDCTGNICWSFKDGEPLTLQQLFTAENGLQWPDFATEIRTDDNAVWFFGGGRAEHICGAIHPIPHRVLATRQPKEKEAKTTKDAVIAHNGVWPSQNKNGFIMVVSTSVNTHYVDNVGYEVVKHDCSYGSGWSSACDYGQFEAEAKRMGCINGYRWGVEYPTNGKRPDLPDDVWVSCKIGGEWDYDDDYSDSVSYWNWPKVQAFKVLDPRYKPADTGHLNASTQPQSLTHSEDGLTHSWYDLGDLPTVGVQVAVTLDKCDRSAEVCGTFCEYVWVRYEDEAMPGTVHKMYIRPIRTDREKFIDAAIACLSEFKSANQVFGEMFDAGFTAPKADK